MWDARTKWKDIGLALSMSQTILDSIGATQRGHPGNCLGKMLAEWLKGTGGGPPITWSTLTAALKKVDEMETIADKATSN